MDIDKPFWEWSLPFLLFYFSPVLIGAVRRARSRHASWPVWRLFLVVLLLGWTVIGWLWALRMAFKDVSLPSWLGPATSGGGGSGSASFGPTSGGAPTSQRTEQRCSNCGGTGRARCIGCGGRSPWDKTVGSCSACNGSGESSCLTCSGSGRVTA